MKLIITGCIRCGAYSSAVDGLCPTCRAAAEGTRPRRGRRRVTVRKKWAA